MIEKFDKALDRAVTALAYVACFIVTAIFVMIVIDVSVRTVGITPPGLTLTCVEYGLLYFAMCSAPWLVRERGHVAIEAVVTILPRPAQVFLAKLVYVLCMGVSLMFAYYSIVLLAEALATMETDIRGVAVPLWMMFAPMPLAFLLVALEFLMYLLGLRSYYNYDLTQVKDGV
ncbi:MAG: TRAP transporter small permease [Proteobacteria bacterium]|nr:TRAP transporter small permease [Pseudomonadota bacterium]MDA1325945.1 TRAP transporter small permease [Pseudomonadota bacterium]